MPILFEKASKMVPVLDNYGIDRFTGFMPSKPPLKRLSPYYEPWEQIMDHLNAYILTGRIKTAIKALPLLSVDKLTSDAEKRRAYTVLTFLGHGYLYGVSNCDIPENILPKSIAVPWFEVAKMLLINPVATYAGVGLWNWYLLDESSPIDLSNMACSHTFSGCFDEAWFYLVPLGVEITGAPILTALIEAQLAVLASNSIVVLEKLKSIGNCISEMTMILKRMYEKCNPAVFYQRIRPYSGGSKNSAAFPNGVFYEGVVAIDDHVVHKIPSPSGMTGTWRMYPGASAGQSPLIHSIDVGLDVEHLPLTHGPNDTLKPNPMLEMREALPGAFQQFIKDLAAGPSIRSFVFSAQSLPELKAEFNSCLNNLKLFRDLHLQIATQYIVNQKKGPGIVGTGGTDLIPFLKQVRKETENAKID